MPIVDISGLSQKEREAKINIRRRLQECFHEHLDVPVGSTEVTFITDETAGGNKGVPVISRLHSKKFMQMGQAQLDALCDAVVLITEEEAEHDYNEAFPVPVMAMRGGDRPYVAKPR